MQFLEIESYHRPGLARKRATHRLRQVRDEEQGAAQVSITVERQDHDLIFPALAEDEVDASLEPAFRGLGIENLREGHGAPWAACGSSLCSWRTMAAMRRVWLLNASTSR